MMRSSIRAGVLLLSLLPLCALSAAPRRERPNVLLIVTDDQGWGDLRAHGNEQIDTPNLDRLAASGASFDRFFVSPVCAPTRASLLTGRYHLRTGVSWVTRGLETMRPEEITLAEVFKSHGYATGCFGKWHNGAHYPSHPNGQGFQEFFGFCAGHWNNYVDTGLERNGKPVRTRGFITDVLTDRAVEFIRKNRERPFLCYVPYNAPHSPFQVPDRYWEKYGKRGLDPKTASVYAMVENVDDNVGRLLRTLDETGLAEDTVVLFLTDNGPNGERYNGGMRGAKGSVHEGGVRAPLFVRWPGKIRAGTRVSQIAAHIDLLPTLTELAGIKTAQALPLDGRSLAPLLRGATEGWPERLLFTHQSRGGEAQLAPGSVRSQRYRLVNAGGRWELFDMEADPGQKTDVAARHPEEVAKLRSAYEEWFRDVTRAGLRRMPVPVGHPEAPVVELPAPEAYFDGGLRYRGRSGWANDWLTGWTGTDGRAWWELDVARPGEYRVTLLYTCPEGDQGSRVRVRAGERSIEGTVAKAHDPEPLPSPDRVPRGEVFEKVWGRLELGTLRLEAGPQRLEVSALSKPGNAVMDLKAVRLERVP